MLSRTKRLLVRIASNPLRVFGFRPTVGVTLRRLLVGTAAAGLATTLSVGIIAYADDRPLPQGVDAAAKTSDLMLNTLFAALTQEFAETTAANVELGKKSISLIFNDQNKDMRLVGTLNPLRANDVPQDSFETTALAYAMNGQNYNDLQRVDGSWYYRRSVALSNFHPACGLCHTNFGPTNNRQWVGALMLRVPVRNSSDDEDR